MITSESVRVRNLKGRFRLVERGIRKMRKENSHNMRVAFLCNRLEMIATMMSDNRQILENEEIDRALWYLECDTAALADKLSSTVNTLNRGGEYAVIGNSTKISAKNSDVVANEDVPSVRTKTVQQVPSVRGKRETLRGVAIWEPTS